MALNKLSIDKLDLKDKRVLIRYVSEKITSLSCVHAHCHGSKFACKFE